MVEFELRTVAGGWEQAAFGPSDQVDWVVRTGAGEQLASYDSVPTILKLYDLASRERPDHPRFLGFAVRERGSDLLVEIHGLRLVTTYADLRAALEPFLADLFVALDQETAGDPAAGRKRLHDSGELLVDLPALYDRLLADR